jgi:hypothetical protein
MSREAGDISVCPYRGGDVTLASVRSDTAPRELTMNTMPGYAAPPLRASDADRDAVLSQLSESFQVGRLTADEFDERSSEALAARTVADLATLTADLPPVLKQARSDQARSDQAGVPGTDPWRGEPGLERASGGQPHGGRVPLLVVAVIVAVAVAGSTAIHLSWSLWWIVPAGLLVARRLTAGGRRSGPFRDR